MENLKYVLATVGAVAVVAGGCALVKMARAYSEQDAPQQIEVSDFLAAMAEGRSQEV